MMSSNEKVGFFEVGPKNYSVMRLVFFILMMFAILAASYVLLKTKGENVSGAVGVFSAVAGVATSLKIIQKQQEVISDRK